MPKVNFHSCHRQRETPFFKLPPNQNLRTGGETFLFHPSTLFSLTFLFFFSYFFKAKYSIKPICYSPASSDYHTLLQIFYDANSLDGRKILQNYTACESHIGFKKGAWNPRAIAKGIFLSPHAAFLDLRSSITLDPIDRHTLKLMCSSHTSSQLLYNFFLLKFKIWIYIFLICNLFFSIYLQFLFCLLFKKKTHTHNLLDFCP